MNLHPKDVYYRKRMPYEEPFRHSIKWCVPERKNNISSTTLNTAFENWQVLSQFLNVVCDLTRLLLFMTTKF